MTGPVLSRRATVVIAGAFGSGKTEVAINYAIACTAARRRVCLVDLDVVTPYFRVGDYRENLERRGVCVVAPPRGLAQFELPALPPNIAGALDEPELHVVLDVGGDPTGARLLALYADRIEDRGYDLWVVANPFRGPTPGAEALAAQARATASAAGLQLTGIVANPHLGDATRPADIASGLQQVRRAAQALGAPLVMLALASGIAPSPEVESLPVLPLQLTVRLPWQSP